MFIMAYLFLLALFFEDILQVHAPQFSGREDLNVAPTGDTGPKEDFKQETLKVHSIGIVGYVPNIAKFITEANRMLYSSWRYSVDQAETEISKMDLVFFADPAIIHKLPKLCKLIDSATFVQKSYRYSIIFLKTVNV